MANRSLLAQCDILHRHVTLVGSGENRTSNKSGHWPPHVAIDPTATFKAEDTISQKR